jgi:uncharacterized membrane protein YbaN (DUF454 family)
MFEVQFIMKFTRGNDVRSDFSKSKRSPRRDARAEGEATACPDVDIDTKAQTIQVCDGRLINAGQRAFCRRLLEAAARRPEIGKAEVDLASASCRIEFAGQAVSSQKMADFFADCVLEAASGFAEAEGSGFGRKPQSWLKMTAYPLGSDVSLWETFDAGSNRVKLRHQFPDDDVRRLPLMAEAISRLDDVERCKANRRSRSLTVNFRHSKHELNGFMDQAERSFEELLAAEPNRRTTDSLGRLSGATGPLTETATGPKRLLYLALAGGSFVMTLVGLVVPGIPTVPFLLATSYFLARSSRWLDEKLRESVYFGSIVTEWEEHGGLGRQSKAKLIALSGAIVLAAIIFSPLSPLGIIALLVISSLSVFGVYRLPDLESAQDPFVAPRVALPAP